MHLDWNDRALKFLKLILVCLDFFKWNNPEFCVCLNQIRLSSSLSVFQTNINAGFIFNGVSTLRCSMKWTEFHDRITELLTHHKAWGPAKATGNNMSIKPYEPAAEGTLFVWNSRITVKMPPSQIMWLFRSGVKKCDYGPEPDCFYVDLFKRSDEQDKLSYVQTGQVGLVWTSFLWRRVTGTEQSVEDSYRVKKKESNCIWIPNL